LIANPQDRNQEPYLFLSYTFPTYFFGVKNWGNIPREIRPNPAKSRYRIFLYFSSTFPINKGVSATFTRPETPHFGDSGGIVPNEGFY
jgi:hypothetical protein